METFKDVAGHIVVSRPEGLTIVDTGVPSGMAAPALVSTALGRPIARLMGCADLPGTTIVDWPTGHITIGATLPRPDHAAPLRMSGLGVPIVPLRINGREAEAVFDTGAPLSYVAADMVAGLTAHDERDDFLPGFGAFRTPVYHVDVAIGARQWTLECGVLPPLLQMALGLLCPSGVIVGTGVMRGACTTFDLTSGWVAFA
jgi:hypothetical protein